MKIGIFNILFLSLIASTFGANFADASTIMKADLDQVAKESELIFEGRAVSKATRPSPTSGKPFTYYTFEIIDIIKGSYSNPTIEMGFMGGTLGDITLEVSDMRMPDIGERGIYFVENIGEQQIHPLFGWQQGHYLVITSQKTGQDMVIPVQQTGQDILIPEQQENLKERSLMLQKGTKLEDFKRNIRNVIRKDK